MGRRFGFNQNICWFLFSGKHSEGDFRKKRVGYRRSTPEEESRFIDGYIGEIPVSIKPITYKTKSMLHENIGVKLIYYEKLKDGIRVEYDF